MKPFRYFTDPLCVIACVCYAVNRWMVPAAWKGVFLSGYFSDLLLIPAALPFALWLNRRLGMRRDDRVPQLNEIVFHLVIWAVAAELIGPWLFSWTTADARDLVAYAAGAVVATGYWHSA